MQGVNADQMMHEEVADPTQIPEFIEVLRQHQAACEQDGKYVEAEMAQKRVQELEVQ